MPETEVSEKRRPGRPLGSKKKPKETQAAKPIADVEPPKLTGLDSLASGDPRNVIALMLWKARHRNPEMTELITEQDLAKYSACIDYLQVTPEVRIVRPMGRPAQPALPEIPPNRRDQRGRPAVPARPAEDPRPFVVVSLVEKGTENAIKPVENNEEDYQAAQVAGNRKRALENALRLAQELKNSALTGNFSTATMEEAAVALATLARE